MPKRKNRCSFLCDFTGDFQVLGNFSLVIVKLEILLEADRDKIKHPEIEWQKDEKSERLDCSIIHF